jgi:hypothetical protein
MSPSRSRQLRAAPEGFYDFRSSTYLRLPSARRCWSHRTQKFKWATDRRLGRQSR